MENTYTEIGGNGLSPHVGGFLWVTHHFHGVHLDRKDSEREHAALIVQIVQGSSQEQTKNKKTAGLKFKCSLQPASFCRPWGEMKVLLQQHVRLPSKMDQLGIESRTKCVCILASTNT